MSHAAKLAAYSSAQAHGGVAAADPHRLIVMLLDGAIERISTARGCMARGDTSEKARLINRAVSIIGELRNSLDLKAGGQDMSLVVDLTTKEQLLLNHGTKEIQKFDSSAAMAALPVTIGEVSVSSKPTDRSRS